MVIHGTFNYGYAVTALVNDELKTAYGTLFYNVSKTTEELIVAALHEAARKLGVTLPYLSALAKEGRIEVTVQELPDMRLR